MLNKKTEILAPAGSFDSVKAAVNAYADAVYLGGSLFSARAFAGNFDENELLKTIDYCHRYDIKVYMAINTLLKNDEINRLPEYVEPYYREGVDGIIVQDMGVVSVLSRNFPDLMLHGSTQLSVSSLQGAAFLKEMGMTRFVPSRELSLSEIKFIKENIDMEIETFVHGAMCYCYSGRCLMSSYAGGRSGNRGRCAQPCRKKYSVSNDEKYALSLKDMCLLKKLDMLIDAGIDSFKIEGRMKKPEYVAATVHAYREVRDAYYSGVDIGKVAEQQEKILLDVYNRGGFCQGYYFQKNGHDMLADTRPNHTGIKVGEVISVEKPYVNIKLCENVSSGDVLEIRGRRENIELTNNVEAHFGNNIRLKAKSFKNIAKGNCVYRTRNNSLLTDIRQNIIETDRKINLNACITAHKDHEIVLTLSTETGDERVSVTGPVCMEASQRPVTLDQMADKIARTGGTDYTISEITGDIEDDIFIQMSALNNMRRQALDDMNDRLACKYRRILQSDMYVKRDSKRCENYLRGMTVGVLTEDQVNIIKKYKCIDNVILDYNVRKYGRELKNCGFTTVMALPEILRQNRMDDVRDSIVSSEKDYDGILIRNFDELGLVRSLNYNGLVVADASLYAYNDEAVYFYSDNTKKLCLISASELTLDEIGGLDAEVVMKIYGYQKVMVTANCIAGNYMHNCGNKKERLCVITDDMGNVFHVRNSCEECCNIIYNGVPTSIMDKYNMQDIKFQNCYIDFTIEDNITVENILGYIENGGNSIMRNVLPAYTRGHYYKGID
ncbi:MAG: U32 family peptidase [Clostridiales bacterium]|nr:U32 family peptidase [Clostridiales bacterium]